MNERIKRFPIGGTHLPEEKHLTTGTPIVDLPIPEMVVIPMKQHLGVPVPIGVSLGQKVVRGQNLGNRASGLSARVHASVTGGVTGFPEITLADGSKIPGVAIKPDFPGTNASQDSQQIILEPLKIDDLDPDAYKTAVIARVEEAGIVGLGGATFPTHIKLDSKQLIDTVIVNGAECEPYITVDDRLMQEKSELLFRGLEIVRRTVGAKQGYVACEINKPAALERLREAAKAYPHLFTQPLDTRYPHGAEKHLVKAVLNREIPMRALPGSVGVLVNNVQTVCAVAEAVDHGKPLCERVVTVSGPGVAEPKNLRIPLGSSIESAIEFCGGTTTKEVSVILGGPMTGNKIEDLSIPVIKATSGIVCLTPEEYAETGYMACIRCGSCVEVCPMYLPPNRMTTYVINDMIDEAVDTGLDACILCGACQFVCPSKRPLVQWIKHGKAAAAAKRK